MSPLPVSCYRKFTFAKSSQKVSEWNEVAWKSRAQYYIDRAGNRKNVISYTREQ